MQKRFNLILILLLLLSACTPNFEKDEEIVQETEETTERAIIPKYKISDEYYRAILPFKPGKARGLVSSTVYNRLDMDELDMGLMRIAQDNFEPNTYYFQEGQYLTTEMVEKWISRADENNQEGLNPPLDPQTATVEDYRNTPRYLSHVMEHNYLKKDDENKVELGGVVIGLALKSVYYFNEPTNGYPREEEIPFAELEKQGKEIALQVLQRVRSIKGLEEIPITIALFREQPRESIVPGNFFAKAYISGNDNTISKWEPINEQYLLFPSDEARDLYYDDYTRMVNFTNDVDTYFPNYIGVIGSGYYLDDQLHEMTIDIPIQFYGKAEIIGFTEYITGLVMDHFPSYIAVHVYISSIDGPEALITRNAGENQKPIVHIYR
ncbi:CamS family sex pheromone protein [Bacillus sp. Marseille-P3661]|uniref:CamS family sex pheromone protein n=1 Tax=Bacillus sp. Marseille-P3661 TaxID=1936234 RepID=UPI000C853D69|nr:CamS family sex pheromone protein [Bacillus sp. Marseille-P3661]